MVKKIRLAYVFLVSFFLICTLFFVYSHFVKADQSVSATIPPRTSDFQFDFASDDSATDFPQGSTLSYTITYGAQSSAGLSTTTILTVDYGNDTINGTHVTDYVIGSASHGYADATPVVDTINKKITWTIPHLPQGTTDQIVTFKLKTNSNYTGNSAVPIDVKATMSNEYVTLPQKTVSKTYTFDITLVTPTPSPTPIPQPTQIPTSSPQSNTTPTPTPSTGPTPTLSPTPVPPEVSVTDVFFNAISNTQGEVSIHVSLPSKLSVSYGTDIHSLSQNASTGDFTPFTKLFLTNLSPGTIYFAQITAIDEKGDKITSEIFTFKTATAPPIVSTNTSSVILTSSGNILSSITPDKTNTQTTLPNSAQYEVTYTVASTTKVKFLELVVRNKNILGINTYTYAQESNIILVPMIEKQPGVYYAKLPPLLLSGQYEVYVRVTETTGNIYEQKVLDINITPPLQVLEKGTHKPIDDARAFFSFYNMQTKQYQPITQTFSNIKNPDFSDAKGFVYTVLPKGKYKVEVSGLFHSSVIKEFSIDANKNYPTIYLEARPFDVMSLARYIGNTLYDLGSNISGYINSLALSTRYFNIVAILVLTTTIIITFLLFSLKTLIPLTRLPHMLYHHFHHALFPNQEGIIFGKVVSPNGLPLTGVIIVFLNNDGKVLFQTATNRQGKFTYKKQKDASRIEFMQEGYEKLEMSITDDLNTIFTLNEPVQNSREMRTTIVDSVENFFGFFFEAFIALSFLLEIAFLIHFGFFRTLPFFVLSLVNIILWIFYTKEVVMEKK